jgi:hypothetical protein
VLVALLLAASWVDTASVHHSLLAATGLGQDTIRTADGKTRRGRILSEMHDGLLFKQDDGLTLLIPFSTIDDLQRGGSERDITQHLKLERDLAEAKAEREKLSPITYTVTALTIGPGCVALGYGLNLYLMPISSIAAFWTFFGLALGGGITFVALTALMIVEWVHYSSATSRIQDATLALDRLEHSAREPQRADPPLVTVWRF